MEIIGCRVVERGMRAPAAGSCTQTIQFVAMSAFV